MRFNALELANLALLPKCKVDKDGILQILERNEGIFKKNIGMYYFYEQVRFGVYMCY